MSGGGHRLEPRRGQAGPHPGTDRAKLFVATADHDRHGERELAEPAAEPGLAPGAERTQTRRQAPGRASEPLAAKVGANRVGQPPQRGEERHPLPGADEGLETFDARADERALRRRAAGGRALPRLRGPQRRSRGAGAPRAPDMRAPWRARAVRPSSNLRARSARPRSTRAPGRRVPRTARASRRAGRARPAYRRAREGRPPPRGIARAARGGASASSACCR